MTVYFLAIHRAEDLLQKLVYNQSKGQLTLKIDKAKLDLFHLRFKFLHPDLKTRDTSSTVTGYRVKADHVSFKVESFVKFFLGQQIVIDSVIVDQPKIEVFKYIETEKKRISVPAEMDKVYKSLEKVLKILNLNYLHIISSSFTIYDRTGKETIPLEVTKLNLTVMNVNEASGTADERFLHADRILLELFDQDIVLPDGIHGIKFKKLRLSTRSQTIKLDSCYIYGRPNEFTGSEFYTFIDTLRISKLDFNLLVRHNQLKMDSALCLNPDIYFLFKGKEQKNGKTAVRETLMTKDSLDFMMKHLLGNLDIGYLNVKNAKVKIVSQKKEQTNTFNASKINFRIEKLAVHPDPSIPIQLGRFWLDIRDYKAYSADSIYIIKFDEIQVLNNTITFNNFRIGPTEANHEWLGKEIKIEAFEFNDINWPVLLQESRIVAGNLKLIKPDLHFKIPKFGNDPKAKKGKDPFNAITLLKNKFDVKGLFIENGSLNVKALDGTLFTVDNLEAMIHVDSLLQSTNFFTALDALDSLSFNKGEYKTKSEQFLIKNGNYSGNSKDLLISQIYQKKASEGLKINLNNINLKKIRINALNDISIADVNWKNADITFSNIGGKAKPATQKSPQNLKISIHKIAGGNTIFNLKEINLEASTRVNQIRTGEVVLENGKLTKINGLLIDGQSFSLQRNQLKGNMTPFYIADNQKSELNNVEIRLPMNEQMMLIDVPKLVFSADIHASMTSGIKGNYFELHQPVISFVPNSEYISPEPGKKRKGFPFLSIGQLTFIQPKFVNLPQKIADKMSLTTGNMNWNLKGIKSDSLGIHLDSLRLHIKQPGFSNKKVRVQTTGNEYLSLLGSDLNYNLPTITGEKPSWSFNLHNLKANEWMFAIQQSDSVAQNITIHSLNLENLWLNSRNLKNPKELLNKNNQFRLYNGNMSLENKHSKIQTYNLRIDQKSNSLNLDSLNISPVADRESFVNESAYRRTWLKLHTGSLTISKLDFGLLLSEQAFVAKKASISNFVYSGYMDKRLLPKPDVYKPMPTELLERLKHKFSIDSLILKNSTIIHEEFNDKTQQLGKITFSNIKGGITGLKNYGLSPKDSLKFNLYTKFMDAADIRMNYAQSYTDTLSSFTMKTIVSSFDLTKMNSLLKPFASAQVNTGYLDTIRMSVVGRKYVAFGVMKMYYRDLNVQFLNKGDTVRKTFKTRLISFFANRLVHKKNQYGSGEVYAERNLEKGFVNYWVKIFTGGIFTNTGVKTDKKQERKYYKTIRMRKVPPIPHIPVDY